MARDKAKDDKYFNCNQEHELNYVSGLYNQKQVVYDFLVKKCRDNAIRYSTHKDIYYLIKEHLGYQIPD